MGNGMLDQWRQRLSKDSIFYKPLVFDLTLVLILKMILLILLWQLAFKPLKPAHKPSIDAQLLSQTKKETNHD